MKRTLPKTTSGRRPHRKYERGTIKETREKIDAALKRRGDDGYRPNRYTRRVKESEPVH